MSIATVKIKVKILLYVPMYNLAYTLNINLKHLNLLTTFKCFVKVLKICFCISNLYLRGWFDNDCPECV